MPVRVTKIEIDEHELARTPGVRDQIREVAQAAADEARDIMSAHARTGRTEAAIGFEVESNGVTARAQTTSRIGHLWEWGSINTPALAPLRRGAESTGARVVAT